MKDGNLAGIEQAAQNRIDIADIKRKYDQGVISREEAKRLAQPILDRINARSAEIAKKHGKANYLIVDFVSVMRSNY